MSSTNIADTKKDVSRRMEGALEVLQKEFGALRTGRASTSLLEPIMIEAYGTQLPLNQVGTVGIPEPRTLTVQVWDKSNVPLVDSAIQKSELGINPQIDGQIIRLRIPDLTEERRKELIKVLKNMGEKGKVSIRNIRREANEELKKKLKDKAISEDENKTYEKSIQKITDSNIESIDKILNEKEKEILQI